MKGKRVVICNPGSLDSLTFEDFSIDKIDPDDVVVKMKYAAMNHLDIWVRKGLRGIKYPIVPCSEGVGGVVEKGSRGKNLNIVQIVLLSPGIEYHLSKSYGIYGETCNETLSNYVKQKSNLWIPLSNCIDYMNDT